MFSFHILTSVCQFKFSSYFLVLHFAFIATTTAVYQVDPLAYEVKHSEYFGVNRLRCELDPSCFEIFVMNDCIMISSYFLILP